MAKNKIILLFTTVFLSLCLFQYINLKRIIPGEKLFEIEIIEDGVASNINGKSSKQEVKMQLDFSKFPVNEIKTVELNFSNEVKAELSQREQKNQVRDWLLYSIVNNIALPEESINKILHDVPIIRYGYNHSIFDLEYGKLRSKLLPDNSVIALIPRTEKAKQKDHLAHIADKQRKNLGTIPEKFLVFEYYIHSTTKKATLLRKEDVDGKVLFGPEFSYHQSSVKNLADLEAFMSDVQDLTFVEKQKDALILGGRKLISRNYRNIRVEDIAAIWQSESKFPDRGTGFSLDPAYDFEGLKSLVRKYPKTVVYALKAAGLVTGNNNYGNIIDTEQSEIIKLVMDELDKKNPTPMLYVYDYAIRNGVIDKTNNVLFSSLFDDNDPLTSPSDENALESYLFQSLFEEYQFQAARYDGDLQGTEVGMILYYTDLLAKMWSMNYEWSTPKKQIPEFANDPQIILSKVYAEESSKYNSGRLWFGPNQNGFQLSDDHTLIFARNATKIFTASKDGLSAENEVPASALIGTPIYWWNDHYEEVAVYEPQYEALNEIMKWSVVISWLNNKNENDEVLNSLESVNVNHDNWFTEWIMKNPGLRFKNWKAVGFYPQHYKGTTTEALPTLYSPSYSQFGITGQRMTGGVTLARRADIAKIKSITKINLDKTLFRSNVEANLGKNTFRTIKGTEFKVLNSKLVSQPSKNARLRNIFTEYSPKPISKTVSNNTGYARFTSKIDDVPIGNLKISPSRNGFQVGFQSRAVGRGNYLARQLSDSKNIQATLKKSSFVDDYIPLKQEQNYLIKLKDSEKWLKVEIVDNPLIELKPEWHFRTAGFKTDSKIVRQKWISKAEARKWANESGKKYTPDISETKPPKILDDYVAKKYDRVTQEVMEARNPLEIKKLTDDYLKQELKNIDQLLDKGDSFFIAEERLIKLSELCGNKPEITMRKALLNLNQKLSGNNQLGINQLNQVANKFGKNNARLLDEINRSIKNTPMRFADQKATQNFMNFKAGKSNVLVVEGKTLPNGEIVNSYEAISKLQKNEAILYVQDNPGLNNLNWNTSANQTLSTVVELHPEAIIRKIPKQSLSMYQPELSFRVELSTLGSSRPKIKIDIVKVKPGSYINNHCDDDGIECKDVYVLNLSKKAI